MIDSRLFEAAVRRELESPEVYRRRNQKSRAARAGMRRCCWGHRRPGLRDVALSGRTGVLLPHRRRLRSALMLERSTKRCCAARRPALRLTARSSDQTRIPPESSLRAGRRRDPSESSWTRGAARARFLTGSASCCSRRCLWCFSGSRRVSDAEQSLVQGFGIAPELSRA